MSGERVLLAWELGGNLGHLARLLAVAQDIEAAGDEPVWALPAHALTSPFLRHLGHRRVLVPPPVVVPDKVELRSYASILLNVGFGNAAGVAQAVRQWRELHAQVRPDRIVLDTAPMAQLSALMHGWPAIRISNGFDCPPPQCPIFGIRTRGPYAERLNKAHVTQVEMALGRSAQHLGLVAPSLERYLTFPKRFFDCVAETDPYGPRDDVTYVGPLNGLPDREPPVWPSRSENGSRALAYLGSSPMAAEILSTLVTEGFDVLCVATGRVPELPGQHGDRVRIARRPVELGQAMRGCDLVASYAPLGLTTQACLAGKPQILAPTDTEKMLSARRLRASGLAVIVERSDHIGRTLRAARDLRTAPIDWNGPPQHWLRAA